MKPTYQSDRVSLYLGDALDVLPTLATGSVGAVVTDPPYSSGGAFRGDRMANTVAKYVQSGQIIQRQQFSGDSRDQRGFLAWSSLWLCACKHASCDGAVLCSFIDWRQLPTMTDAIQAGGWVWRNLATWWKPGCRMQRGRFSASAEYVVYATNGAHDSDDGEGSPQNVISCAMMNGAEKTHIAEKPIEVLRWILLATKQSCTVLDPFLGSGTHGVAAIETGRNFVGIECDERSYAIAERRIRQAEQDGRLFEQAPPTPAAMDLFAGEA